MVVTLELRGQNHRKREMRCAVIEGGKNDVREEKVTSQGNPKSTPRTLLFSLVKWKGETLSIPDRILKIV